MKKIVLSIMLSLPIFLTSQSLIKYGFVEGILPSGETDKFIDAGFGISGELGINVLGSLDLTVYTGAQTLFKNPDVAKDNKLLIVPVMAKARYYFVPAGVKPFVSLGGGILNTFDGDNEETLFAVRPSIGLKFTKILLDLGYQRSENSKSGEPLETLNLSVGYKF